MQKRHQNDTVFDRLQMKSSSSCLFLFFPLHASFLSEQGDCLFLKNLMRD